MHRRRPLALLVLLVATLPPRSAAAQAYDSSFRFGLGLDYAALPGRDGGLGGLRFQLGARVHEHVAVYWQGQALAGAFVDPELVTATVAGWNAVLVEANVGIFQLGAGPSVDVTVTCDIDTSGNTGGFGGCADRVGPGIAARAGMRFGIFTFSGDLHVTFDVEGDPSAYVVFGIGVQLGDVASRPMPYGVVEGRAARSTEEEPSARAEVEDVAASALPETRRAPSPPSGRALAAPGDASRSAPGRATTPAPTGVAAERGTRATAPVRRFSPADVERAAEPEPEPSAPSTNGGDPDRRLDDELDFADDADPLGGLPAR